MRNLILVVSCLLVVGCGSDTTGPTAGESYFLIQGGSFGSSHACTVTDVTGNMNGENLWYEEYLSLEWDGEYYSYTFPIEATMADSCFLSFFTPDDDDQDVHAFIYINDVQIAHGWAQSGGKAIANYQPQ